MTYNKVIRVRWHSWSRCPRKIGSSLSNVSPLSHIENLIWSNPPCHLVPRSGLVGFNVLKAECCNGHHLLPRYVDVPVLFQPTQERLDLGGMVWVETHRKGVIH